MGNNSPFSVEEYQLSSDSSPSLGFSVEEYHWSQDSNFSVEDYIISDSPINTTRCLEFSIEEYDPYADSGENVGDCQSPESISTQQQRTNVRQEEDTPISAKDDNKSMSPLFLKRVSRRIS